MIVGMKKVSVIAQSKDAVDVVRQLRSLGVLHVEHQQQPKGKDIAALTDTIALVGTAAGILASFPQARGIAQEPGGKHGQTAEQFCRHIIDCSKRNEQMEEFGRSLKAAIVAWQPWGDFDPQRIAEFSAAGVFVQLFQIPSAEVAGLPPGLIVKRVGAEAGIANCLVIARQRVQLPYKELIPPKIGLSAMQRKVEEDSRVVSALRNELIEAQRYSAWLLEYKESCIKEMGFQEALAGMGQQSALAFIRGFVPQGEAVAVLESRARRERWALLIEEPSVDDTVPTLLRNPKWVETVKPVLALLGITPGYHELDVSMMFLVFFSLFFGILIGDAGYGLVYLFLTVWLQKKARLNSSMRQTVHLLYVLSSCAVLWGALTGTFFGQEWLRNLGIQPLVGRLNDVTFMQTFCFFLGALHLSLAHGWRAALKAPSLSALADIGWIGVLWTAFFLARTLILSAAFPSWGIRLAYASVGLVILFTNPQRNMFKAVGEGLGTVALSLMNSFTDVVSYVRLFAVGLAGVAIAETTNGMAGGLGSGVIAMVAGVLIVVIGHALNIVLGPMSVLVHGVRLNVLEYSGHAGVTWSGVPYEPLKE